MALIGKVENFMFYIDSNITGQIKLQVVHCLQPASKHYLHFIGRGKRNNLISPSPPPLLCYNFGQDDKNDNNNDILSSANIGSASGKLGLGLNH